MNIAQKLGYISVIETLKVVTETTTITTTTTTTVEEKYRVVAPEGMHETFMSDSEEEGGEYHLAFILSSFLFHCMLEIEHVLPCCFLIVLLFLRIAHVDFFWLTFKSHQRRIYWKVMVARPTNNMSIYRISTVPPCSPVSFRASTTHHQFRFLFVFR